jgi:hypothetical protein
MLNMAVEKMQSKGASNKRSPASKTTPVVSAENLEYVFDALLNGFGRVKMYHTGNDPVTYEELNQHFADLEDIIPASDLKMPGTNNLDLQRVLGDLQLCAEKSMDLKPEVDEMYAFRFCHILRVM